MASWALVLLAALQAADGEAALDRMRRAWREEFLQEQLRELRSELGCGGIRSLDPLQLEWRLGQTELRLFALGHPATAEAWAREAVENTEAPWERRSAVRVLGTLARSGTPDVDLLLARLVRDEDDDFRRFALPLLVQADDRGKHRDLYKQFARAGDLTAIDALSTCPDTEAVDILLAQRTPEAWESLERIAGLGRATRERFLKASIQGEGYRYGRVEWGIRMARRDGAAWLLPLLAETLEVDRWALPSDAQAAVLRALGELGGWTLGETRARLRRYGYVGDPRMRLAEVLDEKAYPR